MKLPDDFYFTQSNLQDYEDCAYRFYLRHLLHVKWPASVVGDAIAFEKMGQSGARFHRLIQQYLLGIPEDRLRDLALRDPNPEIAEWWENFLQYIPQLLDGQRFIESTLTTSLAGQHLAAKFDLVLVNEDGNLTIFDWKTSKKQIRKDWLLERVQTRLYLLILKQGGASLTDFESIGPEQITMTYWFTASPDTPVKIPYNHHAYQKDQAYFIKTIKIIIEQDSDAFNRTTDHQKCRFCVYRSHCDRGVEPGELASLIDFETHVGSDMLKIDIDRIEEIQF